MTKPVIAAEIHLQINIQFQVVRIPFKIISLYIYLRILQRPLGILITKPLESQPNASRKSRSDR